MIDVACVCVGDEYKPELYINQLWLSLHKHLAQPFRLTVLTDNPDHPYYYNRPIRRIMIPSWPNVSKAWWYKMYLFSPDMGFTNTVLYFDLDVVILNNIDKFLSTSLDKFCILQDFNRKWIRDYPVSNSSIMRWQPEKYYCIWDEFHVTRTAMIGKYRGDQDYLTNFFKQRDDCIWWPAQWAMSFKWEIYRGGLIQSGTGLDTKGNWPAEPEKYQDKTNPWVIPADCSVVVFHGKPNPYDTDFGKQHLIPDI